MGCSSSKAAEETDKRQNENVNPQDNNNDEEEDNDSQQDYEKQKPFEYDLVPELDESQKQFVKDSYDAVFACNSVKNLHKNGWNYLLSNAFKKRFQDKSDQKKFCPLCVLGETNKGKTYIVNLLTNNKLKSGFEHKTEGLSCKFTDFSFEDEEENPEEKKTGEEKFLVFDSAGRSEPLLIDPEERKKLKDEDLKRTVESNNRDLKLSETFMKNLLIKNSKIIIVVVNQLSLAEQYFLYELKNDANFEELYVLHNLFNFKNKNDMLNYINETIVNSLYFDITKDYYQIDSAKENTIDKPFYFVEQQEKNGREKSVITHLILGDIETDDQWIKNFNEKTIDFIKTKMQVCWARDFFYVEQILEDELKYENIIDEHAKLKVEKENNENEEDDWEKGKLKLENRGNNSALSNVAENFEENREFNLIGFTPDYIFYKNEKNKEFVIEVECAGIKDDNIKITGETIKGKVYFHILGRKKFPREIKEKDKPFSIYFSVNTEKENIKIDTSEKINNIRPTYENGIYRKVFPMYKDEIITMRNDKEGGCNII